MEEKTTGAIARVIGVEFGKRDGVFGLHLRLAFSSSQVQDYTLSEMDEIEDLMDSFTAITLNDLLYKKMRIRRYPQPVESAFA